MKRPLVAAAAVAVGLSLMLRDAPDCLSDDPKPADPASPPPAAPPAEPAPAPAPETAPAGPPAPSGMVWVEAATVKPRIGSSSEEVFKLTEKRSKEVQLEVSYEIPVHEVSLRPFFLDQFELTNAQYLFWLDSTKKTTYKTGGAAALSTLEEIASYFAYGTAKASEEQKDGVSWGQLYELNKEELLKNPELAALKHKDGSPDKDAFRHAVLPPDVELKGYKWRLPKLWFVDTDKLAGDAEPDHPVRDVSYLEAEAFAEWAGKHIPTEEEFEWALRGPSMGQYPWGNDWVEETKAGKKVFEKRCNWLDLGKKSKKTFEPTTVAVDDMPEGKSWCGAYHLIGNVSEWTSSWFDPYPGWPGDMKNPWAAYHDHYVRVIRGGSCADRERIALRAAHRNFIGIERLQPPLPGNHFDYTGFRCAQYLVPSLDRLEPAISRLLRPKKVKREQVAAERFAGAAVVHFAPAGAEVKDHVHVIGGSSAVLVAPLESIFPTRAKDGGGEVAKARARTPAELLGLAPAPDEDPAAIGVLQTDVDLSKVKLFDAKAAAATAAAPGARRGSHAPKGPPATKDGDLAHDTYVLGLAHGFVGVYKSNLDLVAFLDKPTITAANLKKDERPPATSLEVDADADLVKCSMWVAIGGRGSDPAEGVLVKFSFSTVAGQLDKATAGSSWRSSWADPAPAPAPAAKDKPKKPK